jgi:hypothetical protein
VAARTSTDCSICDGAATSPAVATLLLADTCGHESAAPSRTRASTNAGPRVAEGAGVANPHMRVSASVRKRFPIDAPIQATGPLNGFRLLLLSMLLPALVQLLSDDRSVRALRMTIRPGAVPPRVPVMADRVEARDA